MRESDCVPSASDGCFFGSPAVFSALKRLGISTGASARAEELLTRLFCLRAPGAVLLSEWFELWFS